MDLGVGGEERRPGAPQQSGVRKKKGWKRVIPVGCAVAFLPAAGWGDYSRGGRR